MSLSREIELVSVYSTLQRNKIRFETEIHLSSHFEIASFSKSLVTKPRLLEKLSLS